MTTSTASQFGAGDQMVGPLRVGDVVADKYLIERTLGVGGMGIVVAARDQLLDRRVAIKFLLPKLAGSETSVQRFVREARAASRITSEHVVRLLEIEKLPSGTPFFVMEYLEGSDLRALLRERGALAPRVAVDYALQALQAVAEGHVNGVIHRDIKPSNLFLSKRADGTALIKVLDFGIAKTLESDGAESSSLTSSDDVRLGSPAYMPPEQLQNPRDVDERSDIWSLGATLYELLCGRPPFEGNGYLDLASRILHQPPTPLGQQNVPHPLPAGLERVLHKCFEKERRARYANAAELAAALAPFGTDDARVSLTRVSGMLGSASSFPALSSGLPHEGAEATLDNAESAEPPRSSDERRTSNIGAMASTPAPAGQRSWSLAVVASLVVAAFFMLRQPLAVPAGSVTAPIAAAPPATPDLSLGENAKVPPLLTAPSITPAPSAAAFPVSAGMPLPPSAKPALTTASHKARPAPVRPLVAAAPGSAGAAAAAPGASLSVVLPPDLQVASTPAEPPTSSAPTTSTRATSASGRSAEIERLIERRR